MERCDVINYLINKYNYKSFLEIGTGPGTFPRIICEEKFGVDPDPATNPTYLMTSDQFFAENHRKFDIIFIDGLHHEEQVTRDILNSLQCLNRNGTIVVHDCFPKSEIAQRVPREVEWWNGDVWKAWMKFRIYPYKMFVVNEDEGCGIIRNDGNSQKTFKPLLPLTYNNLVINAKEWLNLISWEEFKELL
jgi:hypothetical protein